jgi:hypothetical protein
LVAFLSRIYSDYGISGYAIACDEYTAVCIDTAGQARVFGGFPSYDDNAYFVQVNCELTNPNPEVCSAGNALTWNHNGEAVKACKIKGNATGSNMFDLNLWETTSSGTWYNWSVSNGVFQEVVSVEPSCSLGISTSQNEDNILIYPNPATQEFILSVSSESIGKTYKIVDQFGKIVKTGRIESEKHIISIQGIENGYYTISIDNIRLKGLILR